MGGEYMHNKEKDPKIDKKPKTIHKRKIAKILVIGIIVLVIIGAVSGIAYNNGFIPITGLMSVKEPIGNAVALNADSYIEAYPELEDIPNLDKIKYKIYGTDESASIIANDYKQKLQKEGYSVKYAGTVELEEMSFEFTGYLKGLTVVGIITSEDGEEFGYNTIVLYTTGSALDYMEILDWYQQY